MHAPKPDTTVSSLTSSRTLSRLYTRLNFILTACCLHVYCTWRAAVILHRRIKMIMILFLGCLHAPSHMFRSITYTLPVAFFACVRCGSPFAYAPVLVFIGRLFIWLVLVQRILLILCVPTRQCQGVREDGRPLFCQRLGQYLCFGIVCKGWLELGLSQILSQLGFDTCGGRQF